MVVVNFSLCRHNFDKNFLQKIRNFLREYLTKISWQRRCWRCRTFSSTAWSDPFTCLTSVYGITAIVMITNKPCSFFLCRTRTETYADNNWFHLCAVKDFKTYRMYKDGVHLPSDIVVSSALPVYGHNEIYIGDYPTQSNPNWSFIGSLAHLNIWDKALSSATIASIADGGRIYVGNLLGWPDLLKYAVPGTISVRRPSPVMKWSGMHFLVDYDCSVVAMVMMVEILLSWRSCLW